MESEMKRNNQYVQQRSTITLKVWLDPSESWDGSYNVLLPKLSLVHSKKNINKNDCYDHDEDTTSIEDISSLHSLSSLSSSSTDASTQISSIIINHKNIKNNHKEENEEFYDRVITMKHIDIVSMLPCSICCLGYVLVWASPESMVEQFKASLTTTEECIIESIWYPCNLGNSDAPPFGIVAIALAWLMNTPFSFVCSLIHNKKKGMVPSWWNRRNNHEKLDEILLHVTITMISYYTSSSWQYFLMNVVMNGLLVSNYLFCEEEEEDKTVNTNSSSSMNERKMGVVVSIAVGMLLPMLYRGEQGLCVELALVLGLGAFGGSGSWCHSLFQLILVYAPSIMMHASFGLTNEGIIQRVGQCSFFADV